MQTTETDRPMGRDARGLFNPAPQISVVQIEPGQLCIVLDNALNHPESLIDWASTQSFEAPRSYPYPGLVIEAPAAVTQAVSDHFALHARSRLRGRRTQGTTVRLSLITLPPQGLEPIQWQCHRDRLAADPDRVLFAAMVLYLFRDPSLGGTSFYRPRQSLERTEQMVADSQVLDAAAFGERYGLSAGYMLGSNAYFDRIAQVPAAWNRMIYYDGGLYHSADISAPDRLSPDPRSGRLTLNGFLTCTRSVG